MPKKMKNDTTLADEIETRIRQLQDDFGELLRCVVNARGETSSTPNLVQAAWDARHPDEPAPAPAPKAARRDRPPKAREEATDETPMGTATAPRRQQEVLPSKQYSADELATLTRRELVPIAQALGVETEGQQPKALRTAILQAQGGATFSSNTVAGGECEITGEACDVLYLVKDSEGNTWSVSEVVKKAVESGTSIDDLASGDVMLEDCG